MADSKTVELGDLVRQIATQARAAALKLSILPTEKKNTVLLRIADLLIENSQRIQAANQVDLENGKIAGLSSALIDRLALDDSRISKMAEGVRQVADLPDPVGELIENMDNPRGLDIRKVRVPVGVVGVIYESRPNVTVDCAVLCFKSGNAAILRGGKEAFESNTVLAAIIEEALVAEGLDPRMITLIPTTDRAALGALLKQDDLVQAVIPRGGEGLIRFAVENSNIPVIKHYTGVCNLYLDASVDLDMAVNIAVNAKCQRPGVCNAIENLIVHEDTCASVFPVVAKSLADAGVELRVDAELSAVLKSEGIDHEIATEEDYSEEYLDFVLAVKKVASVDEAISFINQYGSGHSDSILTESEENAQSFLNQVDSATVYWNASTRFTDGFEFGLGAEIGISTDRLHARGPMGLKELCTYKYVIHGKGEIRG